MTDHMTLNAYQSEVRRTALGNPLAPTTRERLINFALGLAGESGEVVDLIKKLHYHGKAVHASDLAKELGDVLWYVAATADALGVSLEDVAKTNVDKLRSRFPNGFTAADANRKADEAGLAQEPAARPAMHLPAQMTELRLRLEGLKTSIKGMAGHDYLAVAADNCLRLVPVAHDDNITAKEKP